MDIALGIFFRWLHVITACVAVGGLFFMRVVVPLALRTMDPVPQKEVFLRFRRVFKIVVHSSILLLLVSGTYNAWRNWDVYKLNVPMTHAGLGIHLLLGLSVFVLALVLVAGREPRKSHRSWMTINLLLIVLVVAAGAALKSFRETGMLQRGSAPAAKQ